MVAHEPERRLRRIRREQVLIYQSMLGAWPIEPERLKQYVTKALREGKTHTSWIDIDEDYEGRVLVLLDGLYSNEKFLGDFGRLQKKARILRRPFLPFAARA